MKTTTKVFITLFALIAWGLALTCYFTPTKEQHDLSIMVHRADSIEMISGKMAGKTFIVNHHYDFIYSPNGEKAWCNSYKGKWYSNYPYTFDMSDTSVYKDGKFLYSFSQQCEETDFQHRMDDTSQIMHSEIKVQELGETYLYYRAIEPRYLNND